MLIVYIKVMRHYESIHHGCKSENWGVLAPLVPQRNSNGTNRIMKKEMALKKWPWTKWKQSSRGILIRQRNSCVSHLTTDLTWFLHDLKGNPTKNSDPTDISNVVEPRFRISAMWWSKNSSQTHCENHKPRVQDQIQRPSICELIFNGLLGKRHVRHQSIVTWGTNWSCSTLLT